MEEIHVLIEIPKSSWSKFEIDKDQERLTVDRFIYTAMGYPFNYYIYLTLKQKMATQLM